MTIFSGKYRPGKHIFICDSTPSLPILVKLVGEILNKRLMIKVKHPSFDILLLKINNKINTHVMLSQYIVLIFSGQNTLLWNVLITVIIYVTLLSSSMIYSVIIYHLGSF